MEERVKYLDHDSLHPEWDHEATIVSASRALNARPYGPAGGFLMRLLPFSP